VVRVAARAGDRSGSAGEHKREAGRAARKQAQAQHTPEAGLHRREHKGNSKGRNRADNTGHSTVPERKSAVLSQCRYERQLEPASTAKEPPKTREPVSGPRRVSFREAKRLAHHGRRIDLIVIGKEAEAFQARSFLSGVEQAPRRPEKRPPPSSPVNSSALHRQGLWLFKLPKSVKQ
jgi:hypothetical protein